MWNPDVFSKLQQPSIGPVNKHRPLWMMETPDLLGHRKTQSNGNVDNLLMLGNDRNETEHLEYREEEPLAWLPHQKVPELAIYKSSPEHLLKRQCALAPEDFQDSPLKKYRPAEDPHHPRKSKGHNNYLRDLINISVEQEKLGQIGHGKQYQNILEKSSEYESEAPVGNMTYDGVYGKVPVGRNKLSPLSVETCSPTPNKWKLPAGINSENTGENIITRHELTDMYATPQGQRPGHFQSPRRVGYDTLDDFEPDQSSQYTRQPGKLRYSFTVTYMYINVYIYHMTLCPV